VYSVTHASEDGVFLKRQRISGPLSELQMAEMAYANAQIRALGRDDTEVKGSIVHGLGLFAKKKFKKNEVICKYDGTLILADSKAITAMSSDYLLEICDGVYIDGVAINKNPGRYINDGKSMPHGNNSYFSPFPAGKSASIKASKTIGIGDEIYAAYGLSYHKAKKT
jgi:hypothetical protein